MSDYEEYNLDDDDVIIHGDPNLAYYVPPSSSSEVTLFVDSSGYISAKYEV